MGVRTRKPTGPGNGSGAGGRWARLSLALLVAAGAILYAVAVPGTAMTSAAKHDHGESDRKASHKHKRGADSVLRNGFVYTVDERNSVAQAIAIDDGEIKYVGTNKGAKKFIGRRTDVTDLGGRMVMPGLHEGHIHDITNSDQETCDLEAEPLTVPELQARVQACLDDPDLHTANPGDPDDFLIVDNLYMQFLRPAGTAPHKSMLDALDTDRPITVSAAVTGHTTLVNQNALDLAGIDASTPDPVGGRIDHDPDGEPNGLLQDAAGGLVNSLIPPPPPVTPERQVELAGERMQEFSQEGITSFFDPGGGSAARLGTFQALGDQGGLTVRPHFAIRTGVAGVIDPTAFWSSFKTLRRQFERPEELPVSVRDWRPGKQYGPELVARPGVVVSGAKVLLDGIAQFPGQTAAMTEPYLENVGTVEDPIYQPRTDPDAKGELFNTSREIGKFVAEAERRGIQSHIHAIGDQAVRTALDGFEQGRRENGKLELEAHETIAHAEVVHPSDYKRFGEFGVTASMGLQWAKPAPDSTEAVKPYMSGNRWDLYEPTVPITNGGGRVSLGSDCCLDPFDEWFGLEVLILREADWGPEFPQFEGKLNALPGLPLREALRAMTIHGAYQMHQEEVTGSLEKGKLADLIVLNQNITEVDPEQIGDTDVLMTLVGGKRVWVDPALEREWGPASTWPAD